MDLEHAPWDFMWCLFKEHMENMPLLSSSLLLKLTQLRVKARFLWMLCRILLPPSFLSFSGFLTDVLFLAKLSWNKNATENFVWESCCFPPAEKELRVLQWFTIVIKVLKMQMDYSNQARLISTVHYSQPYFHQASFEIGFCSQITLTILHFVISCWKFCVNRNVLKEVTESDLFNFNQLNISLTYLTRDPLYFSPFMYIFTNTCSKEHLNLPWAEPVQVLAQLLEVSLICCFAECPITAFQHAIYYFFKSIVMNSQKYWGSLSFQHLYFRK